MILQFKKNQMVQLFYVNDQKQAPLKFIGFQTIENSLDQKTCQAF